MGKKRKNRRNTDSSQSSSSVSDTSFLKDSEQTKKQKTEAEFTLAVNMADGSSGDNSKKMEGSCDTVFSLSSSSSSTFTLTDVMEKLCKIEREVSGLRTTVEELRGVVFEVQQENTKLRKEVTEAKQREEDLRQQLREVRHLAEVADRQADQTSCYVKRNNMRIYGVPESSTESPQQCEDKVLALFRTQLKLEVSRDDIEAVHRVGQRRPPSAGSTTSPGDGQKPRGIIIRFVSRRVRDKVLYSRKGLKGSGIIFVEDLSPRSYALLTTVKSDSVCAQAWSRNGQIIMKTHSGEKVPIQSIAHLRQHERRAIWSQKK